MGIEENKALAGRFVTALNNGDLASLEELLSDDYQEVNTLFPFPIDKQLAIGLQNAAHRAYPDSRYTLEERIAEGDRVVDHVTFRGTQTGEFLELPATGKQLTLSSVWIYHIVQGKIARIYGIADRLSLFEQQGIDPSMAKIDPSILSMHEGSGTGAQDKSALARMRQIFDI